MEMLEGESPIMRLMKEESPAMRMFERGCKEKSPAMMLFERRDPAIQRVWDDIEHPKKVYQYKEEREIIVEHGIVKKVKLKREFRRKK
jgi:hypothetical protein